jgi:hypothetical protein
MVLAQNTGLINGMILPAKSLRFPGSVPFVVVQYGVPFFLVRLVQCGLIIALNLFVFPQPAGLFEVSRIICDPYLFFRLHPRVRKWIGLLNSYVLSTIFAPF